jgi:3-oxoacyl-[acyl-carrier protein] reductase
VIVAKPLLKSKRILITGGTRGLGRAMALEFARQGADLLLTYANNEESAKKTIDDLKDFGTNVSAVKLLVLDKLSLENLKTRLEKEWGRLDVLVNNAGVSQALPLALMDEGDWDQVMDTNIKGIYTVTRTFLPLMIRQRGGVILNIGSLAGTKLIAAPIHYCTSKAATKGFTEALCKEVGRYNIRVNCLAPGLLEDGVAKNIPEDKVADFIDNISLRRCGRLSEIATFASFLVSDKNSYMSGATLLVDGGF